jgi:hypothetical protein
MTRIKFYKKNSSKSFFINGYIAKSKNENLFSKKEKHEKLFRNVKKRVFTKNILKIHIPNNING